MLLKEVRSFVNDSIVREVAAVEMPRHELAKAGRDLRGHEKAPALSDVFGDRGDTIKKRRVGFRSQSRNAGGPPVPDGWGGAEPITFLNEVRIVIGVVEVNEEPRGHALDNRDGREAPRGRREWYRTS